MKFNYVSVDLKQAKAEIIVLFVPTQEKLTETKLKQLDKQLNGRISSLIESDEFTGYEGQVATIDSPKSWLSTRVILVGLGDKKHITPDSYRKAAGIVSRNRSLAYSKKAVFHLGAIENPAIFQAVIEGYILGSYRNLDYKTSTQFKDYNNLKEIIFAIDNKRLLKRLQTAIEKGLILAEGQCQVRRLAATPANDLTPRDFSHIAQKITRKHDSVSCRVLDERSITREKMGGLLSVTKGSDEPPRFVVLEYKGGRAAQKPVVLVGKGVTYDSGGLSLKKADMMPEMKGDMAGAAIVMTVIEIAAKLGLKINLVALMPLAENMPSAKATRPGDIITMRKGLTVEIINTDAEGRLLLADGLDFANEFNPQAVIDIATLTGGALYVLGYEGTPIMGNNPVLMDRIREASDISAERVWEMPIWDGFRNTMKSDLADLVNSGGKAAATMTAAAFLENFIGDWPWAHVDIAYVDVEPKGRPYIPKGTTGVGLRLLVELLSNWKKV